MARGEAFLLDQAGSCDPGALARLGRNLLHTLDPGHGNVLEAAEAAQVEARELWVVPRRAGGYTVKGQLDAELGSALLSAFTPYAAPRPAAEGARDLRSPATRGSSR